MMTLILVISVTNIVKPVMNQLKTPMNVPLVKMTLDVYREPGVMDITKYVYLKDLTVTEIPLLHQE